MNANYSVFNDYRQFRQMSQLEILQGLYCQNLRVLGPKQINGMFCRKRLKSSSDNISDPVTS